MSSPHSVQASSRQNLALFKGLWPKVRRLLLDPRRMVGLFRWLFPLWWKGGWRAVVHARQDQIAGHAFAAQYTRWVQTEDQISADDETEIIKQIDRLTFRPLVSVVMPVYNVDEKWLRRVIDTVKEQYYPYWELCIADDCSPAPHIKHVLKEYAARDPRIKVKFRTQNGHISEASNSALQLATGEFTALLDHDDELTKHALYCVVAKLNQHPDAELIYSDEDKIDANGYRYNPHFKSTWNPDLFYSFNLITHLAVFRTDRLRAIGGFRKGYEGSQDYDLVCRVLSEIDASKIHHIPFILYHWRAIPGSTALQSSEKNYAVDAARRAISDHLLKTQPISTEVVAGHGPLHRVVYDLSVPYPRVGLLIWDETRKSDPVLKELKKDKNWAESLEIHFLDHAQSFPSAANAAAQKARGEVLVFWNAALKPLSSDWLREVVSHAMRSEIGAVGAKVYYPDHTIHHAGLILGPQGVVGSAHQSYSEYLPADLGRAVCLQSVSAVAADCLVTRKSIFDEVGGFQEGEFSRVLFDVDYCLKVREHKYRVLWTPYAEFVLSGVPLCPYDLGQAQLGLHYPEEIKELCSRWGARLSEDRYYNPNLSLDPANYGVAIPPRMQKPWRVVANEKA